jgi:hypothetical protein
VYFEQSKPLNQHNRGGHGQNNGFEDLRMDCRPHASDLTLAYRDSNGKSVLGSDRRAWHRFWTDGLTGNNPDLVKSIDHQMPDDSAQYRIVPGYGMADLEWKLPNSPTTRFNIASMQT